MAIDTFKPVIWSDLIYDGYEKSIVFGSLANRNYEGEIKGKGSSVKILSIGDVTLRDYTGAALTYEAIDDNEAILAIDKAQYVAIGIDDVDAAQSSVKLMTQTAAKFGNKMAFGVDSYIGGLHAGATTKVGTTVAPVEINSANALTTIAGIATAMSDLDAPEAGRVLVVPNWLGEKLVLSKLVSTDNVDAVNKGYIGSVLGFEVYKSNAVAKSGTDWYAAMAFVRNDSIALAQQLIKTEALRSEDSFADKLRGLSVYGAKICNPNGVAALYCAPKAEA